MTRFSNYNFTKLLPQRWLLVSHISFYLLRFYKENCPKKNVSGSGLFATVVLKQNDNHCLSRQNVQQTLNLLKHLELSLEFKDKAVSDSNVSSSGKNQSDGRVKAIHGRETLLLSFATSPLRNLCGSFLHPHVFKLNKL